MSAQKRKNMLRGFGLVAILLAITVVFVAPNFSSRNEDASGAIGAVQKHRQPQIQSTDVVLGDEQVKKDQQVAYVDFLNDAAALQAISASLASEAQSVDSRSRMEAASKSLEARKNDLQARALAHAEAAAMEAKSLGIADISLEARDVDSMAARVRNAADSLEAKKIGHRRLESAEAEVAAFAARIGSEAQSLDAAQRLESAFKADAAGARIRARAEYLAAIAKEAKSLDAASRSLADLQAKSLAAKSLDAKSLAAVSRDLASEAQALEARALVGMKRNLDSHSESLEALGRMDAQLVAARGSLEARNLASAEQELNSVSRMVKGHAADLQQRSSVDMRSQLEAARAHLDSRNVSAQSLAAFSTHFGALSQSVENKSALASAMPDSADFAAQVRNLASRAAADLQARDRQ